MSKKGEVKEELYDLLDDYMLYKGFSESSLYDFYKWLRSVR